MSIIVWLIVGGIIGWLASLLAGTDERMGVFANIVVGIVGAFLGGLLPSFIWLYFLAGLPGCLSFYTDV